MAMAGLYQILQPLLPLAHLIPEPRQVALRVTVGAPPEPFALAMAALELLADPAAGQPLLEVAEDLHWLDPATIGVAVQKRRSSTARPSLFTLAIT
jgi:hypothetical protein